MFKRIIFAYQNAKHYKVEIAETLRSSAWRAQSIFELNLKQLKSLGVEVLVLDFDGVLAAHAEAYPDKKAQIWLPQLTEQWDPKKVYLLSNKPLSSRQQFFKQHYPQFKWITNVAKKPYPDGLLKVIEQAKVAPNQVALVDDRLLTGVLASMLARTRVIYIEKPMHNFFKRPVREAYFAFLRYLEKKWIL